MIFVAMNFCFTSVDTHTHFQRSLTPVFRLQFSLHLYGCLQPIVRSIECHTQSISNDLKDITMVRLHGFTQNCMVSCPHRLPFCWMFLCQFGTGFNIGEEERHNPRWQHGDCWFLRQRKLVDWSYTTRNF
jgi:hypothetical protein